MRKGAAVRVIRADDGRIYATTRYGHWDGTITPTDDDQDVTADVLAIYRALLKDTPTEQAEAEAT